MFDRIKRIPPLTILTAELLLLSAGAFGTAHYMKTRRETPAKEQSAPKISAEVVNSAKYAATALTEEGSIDRVRAVMITEGEGYVRFNIQLLDSDGTPLSDELKQKQADIEVFKTYTTDPDMPSYEAFNDEYHNLMNDYTVLQNKASAALAAFCSEDGKPAAYSDDMMFISSEDGCSCTLIYKKKLSAGDTAELYSSIAVPDDDDVDTEFEVYLKNEDNSYRSELTDTGVCQLLGTGFGIHVTAEVVPSDGSDTAYTAFLKADEGG